MNILDLHLERKVEQFFTLFIMLKIPLQPIKSASIQLKMLAID